MSAIKFFSTNGHPERVDFRRALLTGQAPDDAEQEQSYYILSITDDSQIQRAFEVARNLVNQNTVNNPALTPTPEGEGSASNSEAEASSK